MTEELSKIRKHLAKGTAEAFDQLFELLGDALFRYVYCQLKCQQDAADVIQETFVKLVKNHRKLGKVSNLKAYVFVCARNEMIRFLNRKKSTVQQSDAELVEPIRTADFEQWEWIEATLSTVEPQVRQIVLLKVFSQLTFEEIGLVLELNPSTIATRYRRTMQKLEIKLSNHVDG